MSNKIKFAETFIKDSYKNQFKNAKQNVFTSFELCEKLINKADKIGNSIFALNPEFAYVLIFIKKINPKHIVAFIDDDRKEVLCKELGVTRFAKYEESTEHIYYYDNNDLELEDVIFDNIIGNPAYAKDFHLKMLEEALKNLSEDGICIWLHPASWAQDPLSTYKKGSSLFKRFKDLPWNNFDVIPVGEANDLFETGIPSDLIISTLNKTGKLISPDSLINTIEKSIVSKVISKNSKLKDSIDKFKEDGIRVKIREIINLPGNFHGQKANVDSVCIVLYNHDQIFIDGFTSNGISWKDIGSPNGQIKKSIPWSIKFSSYEEAANFVDSVKTKTYMGLIAIMKKNSHVPFGYLPYLDNYSSCWSDSDICAFFNFTKEEVDYIYCTVNKYISG